MSKHSGLALCFTFLKVYFVLCMKQYCVFIAHGNEQAFDYPIGLNMLCVYLDTLKLVENFATSMFSIYKEKALEKEWEHFMANNDFCIKKANNVT